MLTIFFEDKVERLKDRVGSPSRCALLAQAFFFLKAVAASIFPPILPVIRVLGGRTPVKPTFEFVHGMGKPPFFKNGSRHGGHSAGGFRHAALLDAAKQPLFECFRIRILLDGALEQIPLDREPDRIRRLVALAASPASLGGFERGEQSPANLRRPNRFEIFDGQCYGPREKIVSFGIAAFPTTISSENPPPSARRYPCSIAAISRSTPARSSTMTLAGGLPGAWQKF
jgi:hypothetical protein